MRLKIELSQDQNKVYMQVLEMDKKFQVYGNHYDARNSISVRSVGGPQLNVEGIIYLRGDCASENNRRVSITLNTQEEAKQYKAQIIEALEEWSTTWPGFDKRKKPCREVGSKLSYTDTQTQVGIIEVHTF